jgi:hypothetical protein
VSLPYSGLKSKPSKKQAWSRQTVLIGCFILAFSWFTLQPWRWKRHVLSKRLLNFVGLQGVSQNTEFFRTTSVKTLNPKYMHNFCSISHTILMYCAQLFSLFRGNRDLVMQRLVSLCRLYSLLLHSVYNNSKWSNIIFVTSIFNALARPKGYPGYVTEQPILCTPLSVYLGVRQF